MIVRKGLDYVAVTILVIYAAPGLAQVELADSSKCNCYKSNGTSADYFKNHVFMDFRNLGQFAGVPAVIDSQTGTSAASTSSSYFRTDDWRGFWAIQRWNNSMLLTTTDATVLRINSPNNIYIERNLDGGSDTYLTFRTVRMPDFQSSAEIESVSRGLQFLSVRMLARTTGDPGACTAMFTYRPSSDPIGVQEADLEIRTRDPSTMVQYTNQPSYTPGGDVIAASTRNTTLPDGRQWTDWSVHRMDWQQGRTTWYVDGIQTASIAFQTPRDPSQLLFSAWSDGGVWSGNMSVGAAAFMNVQWIEILFNESDRNLTPDQPAHPHKQSNGGCAVVCSIDETPVTGVPVILENNAAARWRGATWAGRLWMPFVVMGSMLAMNLTGTY